MTWTHNTLANDLAAHLRSTSDRMVWTDMQIGPSGSPRPDVYTIPKSYSKFRPMAYEVKVSVADFRRDATAGKWQSYLKFSSGVIFAVPRGLLTKADVPPGCGLMVRAPDTEAAKGGWTNVKGPTLSVTENLPLEAWMKLIIDGLTRQRGHGGRYAHDANYAVARALEKKLGSEVADLFRGVGHAKDRLNQKKTELDTLISTIAKEIDNAKEARMSQAEKRIADERTELEKIRADIAATFGCAPEDWWRVRELAKELTSDRAGKAEIDVCIRALEAAKRQIDLALDRSTEARSKVLAGGAAVSDDKLEAA